MELELDVAPIKQRDSVLFKQKYIYIHKQNQQRTQVSDVQSSHVDDATIRYEARHLHRNTDQRNLKCESFELLTTSKVLKMKICKQYS